MDFATLFKKISPILKKMARSHNGHGFFIDENDLYQEMCIHIWESFKNGVPEGINTSYIIKGCEFYISNYLRKAREKARIMSLEKPINEQGDILQDILSDTKKPLDELVDRNLVVEDIENNGFTVREKKVFSLLLKGFTLRETGTKLGISHVMVIKVKNRIIDKWHEKEKTEVTKIH